jgi:hypothetical protein
VAAVVCAGLLSGCGPSRGEYVAAATSPTAGAERARYDRWAQDRFAELRALLPWAEWSALRVNETCEVDTATSFGGRDPGTVTCTTGRSLEAGFDGDLVERIKAFDAVAHELGWADGPHTAQAAIQYYQLYRGRPEGPVPYGAGHLPGAGYSSNRPPEAAGCTGPGALGEDWAEKPASTVQWRLTEIPLGSTPLFERITGPDPFAAASDQLTRHAFVMTLGIGSRCTYPAGVTRRRSSP